MRINSNTDKFAVQAQNRDDSKKPKAAEGGQEAGPPASSHWETQLGG